MVSLIWETQNINKEQNNREITGNREVELLPQGRGPWARESGKGQEGKGIKKDVSYV